MSERREECRSVGSLTNKKMNVKHLVYVVTLLFIVISVLACDQKTKFELAEREFGIEIKHNTDFDYENLEHLIFLYHHASEKDKEFARLSLESAYKTMHEKPSDFPMEDYRDAAVTYPTPYVMLGFANGFLKTAKRVLRLSNGVLQQENNNHSAIWYYKGSIFYFELALEFSEAINGPFDKEVIAEIKSKISCINNKIGHYNKNLSAECEEVYDLSFHEFIGLGLRFDN